MVSDELPGFIKSTEKALEALSPWFYILQFLQTQEERCFFSGTVRHRKEFYMGTPEDDNSYKWSALQRMSL